MISLVPVTRENQQLYLEGILEIENASFPSPWKRQAFLQEIANPISHLWAVTAHGALVGYVCFWIVDNVVQILNIAVHSSKRGQGMGYRLIKEVIERGVSRNMKQVWLEVRVSNRAARGLYKKVGFEEVGLRRLYYTDTNEDAITMSLALPEVEETQKP